MLSTGDWANPSESKQGFLYERNESGLSDGQYNNHTEYGEPMRIDDHGTGASA